MESRARKKCLDKERALFPVTMANIEREREAAKARQEMKPLENEEKLTDRKIKELEHELKHGDYTDAKSRTFKVNMRRYGFSISTCVEIAKSARHASQRRKCVV